MRTNPAGIETYITQQYIAFQSFERIYNFTQVINIGRTKYVVKTKVLIFDVRSTKIIIDLPKYKKVCVLIPASEFNEYAQ